MRLPSPVTFKDNGNGTAALSGTPAAGTAGSYPITITASNGVGRRTATQSFTLSSKSGARRHQRQHHNLTAGTLGSFTVG